MPAYTAKLDPTAEASGTELDISDSTAGYFLTAVETPAPDLNPLYATSIDVEGSVPVAEHYENRVVTIGLRVIGTSAANLQTRLAAISKKIGKLAREQGTLKITYPTSDPVTFDVTSATIAGLPTDDSYQTNHRAELTLRFECRPFGRGPVTTYADAVETTNPCLIITAASVPGDALALGKLVVDEDQAVDQWFTHWGLQSRYYDATASAALFWQAESLTAQGGGAATAVGPTGASGTGSNTVLANSLTTSYQSILSTQATGAGAHMSHIGDFRVWARVQVPAANTGNVTLRLSWAEGDFRRFTTNDTVALTDAADGGKWRHLDLGLVHLSKVVQGTQRWEGRIEALSTVVGDDIYVDCLYLMPVTEGYGEARGRVTTPTPTAFTARDEFNQTAGALTAKTAPTGGTWATFLTAADFQVSGSGTVTRATTGDGQEQYAYFGSAIAGQTVQGSLSWSNASISAGVKTGIVARYVDSSNCVEARFDTSAGQFSVRKWVAATQTRLGSAVTATMTAAVVWNVRISIDTAGRVLCWFWRSTETMPTTPQIQTGSDTDLATGGALATGKFGLIDQNVTANANTRTYYEVNAAAFASDAAMFASQSFRLDHTGAYREDSGGTLWPKVSDYRGSYLRIPPAGQEGRTTRIIVKGSRNDPDVGPDSGIDDISAVLSVTPRYLNVPSI